MSQAELARAAGVTQSMISAYESGGRQPSLPVLRRLVDATGMQLSVELTARTLPDTVRGRLLRRLGPQLCATVARFGGENVRVFGSVARGSDNSDSDVDLLVDLPRDVSLLRLLALRRELSAIVGEPVDVVPASSLRADVAAAAARDAVPVTRSDARRLEDVMSAAAAITAHLERGDLSDGLVFDAVRIRLLEIGEAVKAIAAEILSTEPDIPWNDVARMRDYLAHRYFDTDHAIVEATVEQDLPRLVAAARRMLDRADPS